MCRSCGKSVIVARQPTYGAGPPESYRTEIEVLISYSGSKELAVQGCRSGNRYLFAPGVVRSIDINDAVCLVELPGFSYG